MQVKINYDKCNSEYGKDISTVVGQDRGES